MTSLVKQMFIFVYILSVLNQLIQKEDNYLTEQHQFFVKGGRDSILGKIWGICGNKHPTELLVQKRSVLGKKTASFDLPKTNDKKQKNLKFARQIKKFFVELNRMLLIPFVV